MPEAIPCRARLDPDQGAFPVLKCMLCPEQLKGAEWGGTGPKSRRTGLAPQSQAPRRLHHQHHPRPWTVGPARTGPVHSRARS